MKIICLLFIFIMLSLSCTQESNPSSVSGHEFDGTFLLTVSTNVGTTHSISVVTGNLTKTYKSIFGYDIGYLLSDNWNFQDGRYRTLTYDKDGNIISDVSRTKL